MTTISEKKMEAQIKDLEKTIGVLVRALKGLKASVKVLEEKTYRR